MRTRKGTGCQEQDSAASAASTIRQLLHGVQDMSFYHPAGCGQLVCAAGGLVGLGDWKGEGVAKMGARALVRQREK